jgi:hypothetical protein
LYEALRPPILQSAVIKTGCAAKDSGSEKDHLIETPAGVGR